MWEKAGVNVSVVYGSMPPEAYRAATGANAAPTGKVGAPFNPYFVLTAAWCTAACRWRHTRRRRVRTLLPPARCILPQLRAAAADASVMHAGNGCAASLAATLPQLTCPPL